MSYAITPLRSCQVCIYWANLIGNDACEPCASAAAAGSSSLAAPSKTFSQVCTEAGLPTPSEACEEACSPSTEAVDVTPHLSHAAAAVLPTLGSEAAGTSEGVDGKRQELS